MATYTIPAALITVGSSWSTTSSGGDGGGGTGPDPGTVTDPLEVTLSSPADGDVVATSYPQFIVGVDTSDEDDDAVFTLTIEYDDNVAFTDPVTLTGTFTTVEAGAYLSPSAAVPADTWWRAKVSQGSTDRSSWSDPAEFTVDSAITSTELPITWTVDAAADRPVHLWHIDPPGPNIGDTVTVYGQGFPTTGHLSFGDAFLDVQSWTLVAASDTADTSDDRMIDADRVDPEHYEVTFVAPVYDGPGAALTVEP